MLWFTHEVVQIARDVIARKGRGLLAVDRGVA
jgi:hypothetical protein